MNSTTLNEKEYNIKNNNKNNNEMTNNIYKKKRKENKLYNKTNLKMMQGQKTQNR